MEGVAASSYPASSGRSGSYPAATQLAVEGVAATQLAVEGVAATQLAVEGVAACRCHLPPDCLVATSEVGDVISVHIQVIRAPYSSHVT